MRKLVLTSLMLAALSGCKVGIDVAVYTADIFDALEGGEAITTPMVLSFEVSGADGCAKASGGLQSSLISSYGSADFIGCNRVDFETFAQFRVPVELVLEDVNEIADSDQPIYIGIRRVEDNLLWVAFWRNPESLEAFEASLPSELTAYRSGNLDLALSATLSNDLREGVEITVNDVFVDGAALQSSRTFEIERRDEIGITLSDVTNTAMIQGDHSATIAWIVTGTPSGEVASE